jgi:uncharacterized protein involved in exopolysaccharide biosynthesis/Mrp family chromosome partitioning ATPase
MNRLLTGTIQPPPEPVIPEARGGSLRDILEILFRHKFKMILFLGAVVLSAATFLMKMQHTYTSEAKILVRRGRENFLLDPTVATGEVTPLFMDWENNMNSEIEILTSKELAGQVVRLIGPTRFVDPPKAEAPNGSDLNAGEWLKKQWTGVQQLKAADPGPVGDEMLISRAVTLLSESLDVKVILKSNIIAISFESPDPELARLVVSTLLDQYSQMHILANRAPGAHEFFLRETQTLKQQLEKAEDTLRDLKDKNGILAIDIQRTILLNRISELQNLAGTIMGQIAASSARVESGEEAVRKEAASGSKVLPQLPSITYRDARSELQAEKTALAGLQAQAEIVNMQIAEAQGKMKGLNDHELMLTRLERDRDMLKDKYTKYCQNLEQTRIDMALQLEKISNISVIQPPTMPAYPNPLNRAIKLAMALMVGLAGSVAVAFMSDHFDHSIRKPEDLENALRLPTLVSIPRLRSRRIFPVFSRLEEGEPQGRSYAFLQGRRYYNSLRDRIQMITDPEGGRDGSLVIGITSSHSGEGVSSVAANLAISFAESCQNDRVLLVDANRNQPSAHSVFGIKKAPGAAEISTDLQGRLIIVEQNLYEVPNGAAPEPNTGTLAVYYNSLLRLVKDRQYRFVIFDMPPLSEGSPLQLARLMDGIILVVKAEGVRCEVVQRMKNLLQDINANVLGSVLNKRRFYIPGWLYRRL